MITFFSQLSDNVIRKFVLTIAGLCLSISGCQVQNSIANPDFLTVVKIEELKLTLHHRQGRCAIRINDDPQSVLLDIPYPCGFVRANEKLVAQTYQYEGVGQVFVVAGPLVDINAYTENAGVNPEHMCSNQGQAIIVQDGKLALRQSRYVPLGFCHHLGFDEKDYYGFAHPID